MVAFWANWVLQQIYATYLSGCQNVGNVTGYKVFKKGELDGEAK